LLLDELCQTPTINSLKLKLKTYLFTSAFEEDMVGLYQGGYEKIRSVPGGFTILEKMEKEY